MVQLHLRHFHNLHQQPRLQGTPLRYRRRGRGGAHAQRGGGVARVQQAAAHPRPVGAPSRYRAAQLPPPVLPVSRQLRPQLYGGAARHHRGGRQRGTQLGRGGPFCGGAHADAERSGKGVPAGGGTEAHVGCARTRRGHQDGAVRGGAGGGHVGIGVNRGVGVNRCVGVNRGAGVNRRAGVNSGGSGDGRAVSAVVGVTAHAEG
mmetsp:Transcript_19375/g.60910  ORF Transcript_19375/g.60910 Transcript_19375/m.60910 type:complete len:204 (-) Transcript_19375:178-789(-)|eukprot:scaffold36029_cov90-Isochrysis_galbana.AAC.1